MRLTIVILIAALAACKTGSSAAQNFVPGPHIIVYKTKGDYRKLVPVELSEDKSHIVSYPDPNDLRTTDKNLLPVVLHKGFLLDKRGISKNVAFLKLTYGEYVQLPEVPSLTELYGMILDKDPLVHIYDCGLKSKYKSVVKDINKLIDKGKLKNACKSIQ